MRDIRARSSQGVPHDRQPESPAKAIKSPYRERSSLPVSFALTGATADEHETLLSILDDPALTAGRAGRAGQVIIAGKNYYGHDFEAALAAAGLVLLRPAPKGEPGRRGNQFFKPLRQIIESVNDTFKGQLDLERHGGAHRARHTRSYLAAHPRPAAAICPNDHASQPIMRSLIAYDH